MSRLRRRMILMLGRFAMIRIIFAIDVAVGAGRRWVVLSLVFEAVRTLMMLRHFLEINMIYLYK